MKIIFLLLLFAHCFPLKAQEVSSVKHEVDSIEKIVDTPEIGAQFPGGRGSFLSYISSCVVIPKVAYEMGVSIPKQFIQFVVCSDGMITDIQLLKGTPNCPECDEAFVKCFRNMPDWIPAQVGGKPVNSKVVLPVGIHLR